MRKPRKEHLEVGWEKKGNLGETCSTKFGVDSGIKKKITGTKSRIEINVSYALRISS